MPDRGWCCRLSKKSDRVDEVAVGQTLAQLERLARLMRSASHTEGLNAAQWEALRYLSRANSFSNSPGALTKYLGATKGTTSQTVLSLIKKGAIAKSLRGNDGRSVVLILTDLGWKILNLDPLLSLDKAIAKLGDKTSKRFSKGLSELLQIEANRQGEPSFGNCTGCGHASKEQGEFWCKMLNVNVSSDDAQKLCVYHKPKN
jgi:DNA-binding MarR family transcriptional regulator